MNMAEVTRYVKQILSVVEYYRNYDKDPATNETPSKN